MGSRDSGEVCEWFSIQSSKGKKADIQETENLLEYAFREIRQSEKWILFLGYSSLVSASPPFPD